MQLQLYRNGKVSFRLTQIRWHYT